MQAYCRRVCAVLFASTSMWAVPALAQTDSTEATAPVVDESEIVVTALRRATRLQETPISVSALSGDELREKGIADLAGLASATPSFTLQDNGPSARRPIIRGIQGAGEPQVGIYFDDYPLTSTPGSTNDAGRFAPDLKLYDIDRVEVLKGPQGTLFGAGSMGGTLRYLPAKPELDTFSGQAQAEINQVSKGGVSASIEAGLNVPIVAGVLGIRGLAYGSREAGYIDNVTLGRENANRGEVKGARLSALFTPTDRLTISALGLYQHSHYDAGSAAITSSGDLQTSLGVYDPLDDKVWMGGLTASYKMGFATLTGNASFYKRQVYFTFAFPGLNIPFTSPPVPGLGLTMQPQTATSETYELRLASNGNTPFNWTVGVFQQSRDASLQSEIAFVDTAGVVDRSLPLYLNRFVDSYLDQRAVFGEASYTFFDKLTLTLGARAFDYKVGSTSRTVVNLGGSPGSNIALPANFKASSWIPKANLSYQATRDFLIYAQFSEGYRPGGANQQADPLIPPGYGADNVKNYEVGIKSQWFDRRLTANLAAYRMDWSNIQVAGSTPNGLFRFTTNAGAARVNGFELELNGRLTDDWDAGFNLGYVDAQLTEDQPFIPGVPRRGLAGQRLPAVPKTTMNIFSSYGVDIGTLRATLRAEWRYIDGTKNSFNPYLVSATTGTVTSVADPFFARMPSYTLTNISADLKRADSWTATLFVNNVFDNRGKTFVLIDSFNPAPGATYFVRPRTAGLRLSTSF
jgi:iron complex outermembrane recepter protein